MTRGMAMVLTLITIALAIFAGWYSNQRTDYFPDNLQTTSTLCQPFPGDVMESAVLSEFEDEWYSAVLSAFHEPSLYRRPASTPRSVRFTWLRSFHDPIVVRVDSSTDGRLIMTARQRPGGTGFISARGVGQKREIVRQLSAAEAAALQATIEGVGLFEAPDSGCQCCVDGAQWIIEAADPRLGYRYRGRQSPKEGLERTLGLHLLRLTGWDVGRIY